MRIGNRCDLREYAGQSGSSGKEDAKHEERNELAPVAERRSGGFNQHSLLLLLSQSRQLREGFGVHKRRTSIGSRAYQEPKKRHAERHSSEHYSKVQKKIFNCVFHSFVLSGRSPLSGGNDVN